ncbi:Fe-S protein assembly co-chaperone HscB [Buchnera aphidicola (Neophyllaphis podocarpi)]|uniref:Fe-S protein assembly co-chaperone HscB n=1 Tax=Buchnera aphidicola TaxID=9 RepID=UPI0031B8A1B8
MNYFDLFNLPQIFNINEELLIKNFYELQKKFHPDKLTNSSINLLSSMNNKIILINKGYKILKDPINRAEHLLYLNNFIVDKKSYSHVEKSFLMKNISLFEKLEAIIKEKENSLALSNFINKIILKKNKYLNKLIYLFDLKNFKSIKSILIKMKFLQNLVSQAEKIKEKNNNL